MRVTNIGKRKKILPSNNRRNRRWRHSFLVVEVIDVDVDVVVDGVVQVFVGGAVVVGGVSLFRPVGVVVTR